MNPEIEDYGDGACLECGDFFHLDDTGGYNPPCPCGCGMCRPCCKAEKSGMDPDDGWYPEDGEPPDTEGK